MKIEYIKGTRRVLGEKLISNRARLHVVRNHSTIIRNLIALILPNGP